MKGKKVLVFLFSLIMICSCVTGNRSVKERLSILKPDYFSGDDDLTYVGQVVSDAKESFDVYFNEHLFGNGRMACRLIFFDAAGTPLGCYKVSDKPYIKGCRIIFPYTENDGQVIIVEEKIPEEIYLDGEKILFEKF